MAVRIRLARIGRKKTPFYNLVAIDSRSKRDGAFLADIGTYDGLKGVVVTFKEDIYQDWVSKGAIPSDSAKRVYRIYKRALKKAETPVLVQEAEPKKAKPKKTAAKESVGEQKASEMQDTQKDTVA